LCSFLSDCLKPLQGCGFSKPLVHKANLESWQQEFAQAHAKRLLSMACVTVWEIAADISLEAAELRAFLIER
jgi:hypothetical protein